MEETGILNSVVGCGHRKIYRLVALPQCWPVEQNQAFANIRLVLLNYFIGFSVCWAENSVCCIAAVDYSV